MTYLHNKIQEALPSILQEATIAEDTLLVTYWDFEKNKKMEIKLGRLLTKQTSLTELEIKNLVEFQRRTLKGELLMELTQDADGIVDYYKIHVAPNHGSYSCMHGKNCVSVYSYDERLFLATFYDGEDTSFDNYVGRCLVRNDRMNYIRIYATEQKYQDRIKLTLENAYYTCGGDLVGILLAKEETDEGFIMPYLDGGEQYVEDADRHFMVVAYSTNLQANSTNGIMKFGCTCGYCGEVMEEDEARYTEQEGDVCESCFEDNYVIFDGDTYRISDCTRVIGGEYAGDYVPDSLLSDNDYYEPEDSTDTYHIDELTSYNGGFYLSENCVELAEETDEGESYAPESECTKLTETDLEGLEDWWEFKLGWYTDERYAEILEEIEQLFAVQEADKQRELDEVNEELA